MNDFISRTFSGPFRAVLHPLDEWLAPLGPGTYKFFAVGLFVLTICWVMLGLRKEYVNLDQPRKGILFDLRLWTLISMMPHMIIYWMWAS